MELESEASNSESRELAAKAVPKTIVVDTVDIDYRLTEMTFTHGKAAEHVNDVPGTAEMMAAERRYKEGKVREERDGLFRQLINVYRGVRSNTG